MGLEQIEQMEPLERFVRRLRLRSPLSDEEAAAICALQGREVATKARGTIVRPGQDTTEACLVVRGLVGRYDQLPDGARQITELHIPGDMCDLHSVAVPRASWGIQALCAATTFRVPHKDILDLTARYPAIAMAFWRDTVADASILQKWIGVLGRRKAKARVAHLILGMGLRMEQAGLAPRTCFSLPMTQSQFADVLGLTLTHVHSCLTALRKSKRIHMQGSQIEVLDPDYLIDCAQFDPRYLLLDVKECPTVA